MRKIVFLLTILAILTTRQTVFAFNYVLSKNFISLASQSKPAKGGDVTDSDFHTTFRRITDITIDGVGNTMAIVVYSRWTPINSGKNYLYLQRTAGNPDALLYNAANYSLIRILPAQITIDGVPNQNFMSMESAEIRWDYTGSYPDRFYYVNGTGFYQYDVLTNTAYLIHNFSNEFPTAVQVQNNVEGDSSADSRYWAFIVKGPYNGSSYPTLAIITYDKQTNVILGTMDLAKYQANGGKYNEVPTPNMVEISPSGRKVIYHLGRCWGTPSYGNRSLEIDTVFDGPHAWDLNFSNPVKVSIDETHSGWAWDANGNEMFVSQNNREDWIEARNVMTGATVKILYHGDLGWNNGMHFARMPSFIRGWVLMSTYAGGTNVDWGDNQLIMLEIKDNTQNPRVWRLGHTHNNHDEYYAEGFAAMSQFGDKLWWGAKWPGQNSIEAYEMDLPTKWWEDLEDTPDITAPDVVNNLTATAGTDRGQASLSWTAQGDNGNSGTATTYVIKYSVSAITTDEQFNTATDVTGEPAPSAAGTNQSMTVSGLTPGQTYYFAMKTQDEVPNISGLSNSQSAVTKATPLNNPPVLAPIEAKTVNENMALSFTISASDVDGDTLTYLASGLPTGAAFNTSTRTFSWTPGQNQAGSYAVTFHATDTNNAPDSEIITITVILESEDTEPPYVEGMNPDSDEVQVPLDANITFHIKDKVKGVDINTLSLSVQREGDSAPTDIVLNGENQLSAYPNSVTIQGTPLDYVISYDPPKVSTYQFRYEQVVTVNISASDLAANSMGTYSYSFTTAMMLRGKNLKVGKRK